MVEFKYIKTESGYLFTIGRKAVTEKEFDERLRFTYRAGGYTRHGLKLKGKEVTTWFEYGDTVPATELNALFV